MTATIRKIIITLRYFCCNSCIYKQLFSSLITSSLHWILKVLFPKPIRCVHACLDNHLSILCGWGLPTLFFGGIVLKLQKLRSHHNPTVIQWWKRAWFLASAIILVVLAVPTLQGIVLLNRITMPMIQNH